MKNKSKLFNEIRAVLLEINPVGAYIPSLNNTDEYDYEVSEILIKCSECKSIQDVYQNVYLIFSQAFGEKEARFRSENLNKVAKRILEIFTSQH